MSAVHSLPRVNQPWAVYCAPAEVLHAGHIRCLFVELAHGFQSEAGERRAVATAHREHVEEREERREAVGSDCFEKLVRKRRTTMRGRDRGDREHLKGVVVQV